MIFLALTWKVRFGGTSQLNLLWITQDWVSLQTLHEDITVQILLYQTAETTKSSLRCVISSLHCRCPPWASLRRNIFPKLLEGSVTDVLRECHF